MKILSFQPFSLYANGGGNRILRRLYEGNEENVRSLAVVGVLFPSKKGNIEEIVISASPLTRSWMRWRLRNLAIWLRDVGLKFWTIKKIREAAAPVQCEVIHVVDHGPFSAALCDVSIVKGKKLWVSFHDHFSTTRGCLANTKQLWALADRRLVISEELAREYQKLFGEKDFEIITDGVTGNELSEPLEVSTSPINIYFAGLLHLAYEPLFKVLAEALDRLQEDGYKFRLILRGTQKIEFLNNRRFEVEFRPVSLNSNQLKAELDASSILYLPIKFSTPDFYLYSLSTKMVGYLGGSGGILYHGPVDSAACHLLEESQAAVCCTTLQADDLMQALKHLIENTVAFSGNAKLLAKTHFNLEDIQRRFWLQLK